MNISIKLLENNKTIINNILQALIPQIDNYLKKTFQDIRSSLPSLLEEIIKNTPEYNSLLGGQLQYEFGIPNATTVLSSILDIWLNNIHIEYHRPIISNDKIKASFSISLIHSDFNDVLSSDAALVIDNLRGYQLPWLEWLLLEGNKTIIDKQEVVFGSNQFSRTGYALMKSSNKSWKVPSEFAGTIRDNWITRAIDTNENKIQQLLNKVFA